MSVEQYVAEITVERIGAGIPLAALRQNYIERFGAISRVEFLAALARAASSWPRLADPPTWSAAPWRSRRRPRPAGRLCSRIGGRRHSVRHGCLKAVNRRPSQ
jgi:hypothetical protein